MIALATFSKHRWGPLCALVNFLTSNVWLVLLLTSWPMEVVQLSWVGVPLNQELHFLPAEVLRACWACKGRCLFSLTWPLLLSMIQVPVLPQFPNLHVEWVVPQQGLLEQCWNGRFPDKDLLSS